MISDASFPSLPLPRAANERPQAYRLPPALGRALGALTESVARDLKNPSPRLAPLVDSAQRELFALSPSARTRAQAALKSPDEAAEALAALRLGYAFTLRCALAATLAAKGRMASWPGFLKASQARAEDFARAAFWDGHGLGEAAYPWPDWAALPPSAWAAVETLARSAEELPGPQELYLALFPKALRHAAGEYYTPHWLAEHLLDLAAYSGEGPLLDPTCGSGVFVTAALARHLARQTAAGLSPEAIVAALPMNVVGIDNNPLAVLAARAACLLALPEPVLDSALALCPRLIHEGDVLLAPPELGPFAQVVGNPPWVAYDNLAPGLRERLRPIWEGYGLFPKIGFEAILGGGKKDLSLLISYAVSARYLAPLGRLSFLITRAAFKSAGAAASFRRFRLAPEGPGDLEMLGVEDWSNRPLFFGANTQTVLFSWRRGRETRYPVPYLRREPDAPNGSRPQRLSARPAREADPCSPWLSQSPQNEALLTQLCAPSAYRAFEGANSGGANGIFWLEIQRRSDDGERLFVRNLTECGKQALKPFAGWLEARHIYPLLRARDLSPFKAEPKAAILLLQDPQTRRGIDPERLRREAPLTFAYVSSYAQTLAARAAYKRYFTHPNGTPRAALHSMFNVSEATLAPYKVVYNRVGKGLMAAVLGPIEGRPVIPQETLCLIPCSGPDEAHYLVGLLQSGPLEELLNAYSQSGGKGYAGPHLMRQGAIPRYDEHNDAHRILRDLANACYGAATIAPTRKERLLAAALAVWGLGA